MWDETRVRGWPSMQTHAYLKPERNCIPSTPGGWKVRTPLRKMYCFTPFSTVLHVAISYFSPLMSLYQFSHFLHLFIFLLLFLSLLLSFLTYFHPYVSPSPLRLIISSSYFFYSFCRCFSHYCFLQLFLSLFFFSVMFPLLPVFLLFVSPLFVSLPLVFMSLP